MNIYLSVLSTALTHKYWEILDVLSPKPDGCVFKLAYHTLLKWLLKEVHNLCVFIV